MNGNMKKERERVRESEKEWVPNKAKRAHNPIFSSLSTTTTATIKLKPKLKRNVEHKKKQEDEKEEEWAK